jgi:hypothetical protein
MAPQVNTALQKCRKDFITSILKNLNISKKLMTLLLIFIFNLRNSVLITVLLDIVSA